MKIPRSLAASLPTNADPLKGDCFGTGRIDFGLKDFGGSLIKSNPWNFATFGVIYYLVQCR